MNSNIVKKFVQNDPKKVKTIFTAQIINVYQFLIEIIEMQRGNNCICIHLNSIILHYILKFIFAKIKKTL